MKTIWKFIKISGIFILLVFLLFTSCFQFRTSNSITLKRLEKVGVQAHFETKIYSGLKLNYLQTGADSSACVVFVHGAPGANDAFEEYMKDSVLLKKATLVAVDRPGYGYSDRERNYYSMQEQSNCIGGLLKDLKKKYPKLILVGHSYGGSMVAKLAMDYNSIVDATVQISGAVDPENEKIFWFSKLANSPFVYWSLSKTLKVCTNEKMNHVSDIKTSLNAWDSITKKYTVIHGDEDNIVPYINLDYSKKHLNHSSEVKILSQNECGHLLIWDHYALVRKEILNYL